MVAGELEVDWLSPPGACNEPLIHRLHAVRVHRGVLGSGFLYGLEPPFERELERVGIELPACDGQAPPAPVPPSSMTVDELEAVFADHPVVRCGPEHDPLDLGSSDETDQDTPAADPGEMIGPANDALKDGGIDIERQVVAFVDRTTGGGLGYVVGEDDEATVGQILVDEFDDRAPAVRVTPWAPAEVIDAQLAIGESMTGSDAPGSIVDATGPPGPVSVGLIDPTRESLDAIAETVDPDLVCANPLLSGRPHPRRQPEDTGRRRVATAPAPLEALRPAVAPTGVVAASPRQERRDRASEPRGPPPWLGRSSHREVARTGCDELVVTDRVFVDKNRCST